MAVLCKHSTMKNVMEQNDTAAQQRREAGKTIHRRETRWQLAFPFVLGLLLIAAAFLLVALPSEAIWRVRAQAIGDFTYTMLCLLPVSLLCLFPLYVIVLLGIYGMNRLHDSTERPLRRLENLAANLAQRIENVDEALRSRTANWSTRLAPVMRFLQMFDPPTNDESGDTAHDTSQR